MRKFKDYLAHFLEWALVALFALGSIQTIGAPPLTGEGFLVVWLGGEAALIVYGVWFGAIAVWLALSKIFRWKQAHKNALAAIYLTTIYTFSLAWAIFGLDWSLIDDVVVGVVAAALWLRWKLKTEYIDPNQFEDELAELRDDLPPDLDTHDPT